MVACRLPTLRENGEKVLRNLRASRNNEVPWKHDDRNCKISPIVPLFFEDEPKMINTLRNMYFSEAQRDDSKHAFLNKQDVSLQHASNAVFFLPFSYRSPSPRNTNSPPRSSYLWRPHDLRPSWVMQRSVYIPRCNKACYTVDGSEIWFAPNMYETLQMMGIFTIYLPYQLVIRRISEASTGKTWLIWVARDDR